MEVTYVLPRSQMLVKELTEGLNLSKCTFEQAEERILQFIYELGRALEEEGTGYQKAGFAFPLEGASFAFLRMVLEMQDSRITRASNPVGERADFRAQREDEF
jgi:hypothetical protein